MVFSWRIVTRHGRKVIVIQLLIITFTETSEHFNEISNILKKKNLKIPHQSGSIFISMLFEMSVVCAESSPGTGDRASQPETAAEVAEDSPQHRDREVFVSQMLSAFYL